MQQINQGLMQEFSLTIPTLRNNGVKSLICDSVTGNTGPDSPG
jgi:hypothetical protein